MKKQKVSSLRVFYSLKRRVMPGRHYGYNGWQWEWCGAVHYMTGTVILGGGMLMWHSRPFYRTVWTLEGAALPYLWTETGHGDFTIAHTAKAGRISGVLFCECVGRVWDMWSISRDVYIGIRCFSGCTFQRSRGHGGVCVLLVSEEGFCISCTPPAVPRPVFRWVSASKSAVIVYVSMWPSVPRLVSWDPS